MSYNTKNYTEQGGDVTHIGGKLVFDEGGSIAGFPGAENFTPKNTNTASDIRNDLNTLIKKLKDAGIMIPDEWNVSVLACPTPASMPTSETTANSGHATVTIDGTEITITLNCKISELANANHGETWGTHKWLGFGQAGITWKRDIGEDITDSFTEELVLRLDNFRLNLSHKKNGGKPSVFTVTGIINY